MKRKDELKNRFTFYALNPSMRVRQDDVLMIVSQLYEAILAVSRGCCDYGSAGSAALMFEEFALFRRLEPGPGREEIMAAVIHAMHWNDILSKALAGATDREFDAEKLRQELSRGIALFNSDRTESEQLRLSDLPLLCQHE